MERIGDEMIDPLDKTAEYLYHEEKLKVVEHIMGCAIRQPQRVVVVVLVSPLTYLADISAAKGAYPLQSPVVSLVCRSASAKRRREVTLALLEIG